VEVEYRHGTGEEAGRHETEEGVGLFVYRNGVHTHVYGFRREDPGSLCNVIADQSLNDDHPMKRSEAKGIVKALRDHYLPYESREKAVK